MPLPAGRALFRYGQARDVIAKAGWLVEDQSFVQFLLWVDESHVPRSNLAPFRFTTARRGQALDIIALGQEAVEALLTKGHLISRAIAQEFGSKVSDGREIGMCSVEAGRKPVTYQIPRMVIQKHQYETKFCEAEREEKNGKASTVLRNHVAQVIIRDLVRQAELMAIDIPEDIEIDIIKLDALKPVKVVAGRYNLSARVKFLLSHKLEGQWAVGHLAARGYGRILPDYYK